MSQELDRIDVAILEQLLREGRASIRDLADGIGQPKSTIGDRIERLRFRGIILGFRAVIAPSMLGAELDICADYLLAAPVPIAFRAFDLELQASPGITGLLKTGPGEYRVRSFGREGMRAVERIAAKHGFIIAQSRIKPVFEELVAYRDPPLRALLKPTG